MITITLVLEFFRDDYIGSIGGFIPLLLGFFVGELRAALYAFFACVVAGALGGLYATIAIVAISSANIFQLKTRPAEPEK